MLRGGVTCIGSAAPEPGATRPGPLLAAPPAPHSPPPPPAPPTPSWGPGAQRRVVAPCPGRQGRGTQQSLSVPDHVPLPLQKHVVETFFGFDEESVDSETLSETSCNTDRTDRAPATPEEDLDDVSGPGRRCSRRHFRPLAVARAAAPLRDSAPRGPVTSQPVASGEVVLTALGSVNGSGARGAPLLYPELTSQKKSEATLVELTLCS